MFIINIENLIITKVRIAKHYHIQPSEVDRLPYWEYELLVKTIAEEIKEENKQVEGEQKKYGDMNPSKLTGNISKSMGNMAPKMPNITVNMPKI